MNIYSVVAVSNGVEFIGECVSWESLKAGSFAKIEHLSCTGCKINTFAEIKKIISSDIF